jgi:hypothetical protein
MPVPDLSRYPGAGKPLQLRCRTTGQTVTMVIGKDRCPHCGAEAHGLDLSRLNHAISRLRQPLPTPAG